MFKAFCCGQNHAIIGLAIIGAGLGCSLSPTVSLPKPQARFIPLVVADNSNELGRKWAVTGYQHVLRLENTSAEVLHIASFNSSCDCTVAGKFPDEVAPGGMLEIPIKLDLTRDAQFDAEVIVGGRGNESGRKFRLPFSVTGIAVASGIECKPKDIRLFENLVIGETFSGSTIQILSCEPFKVLSCEVNPKLGVVGMSMSSDREALLTFEPNSNLGPGEFTGEVEMAVQVSEEAETLGPLRISVPVSGRVEYSVEAVPPSVFVPLSKEGVGRSEFFLRSRTGRGFVVTGVHFAPASHGRATIGTSPTSASRTVRIDVEAVSVANTRRVPCEALVDLDIEGQDHPCQLRIPVVCQ